jgi:hypothetical protein
VVKNVSLNVKGKIYHTPPTHSLQQFLILVVKAISRFKRIGRNDGQTGRAKCSFMNLEQSKVKQDFSIFVSVNIQ